MTITKISRWASRDMMGWLMLATALAAHALGARGWQLAVPMLFVAVPWIAVTVYCRRPPPCGARP